MELSEEKQLRQITDEFTKGVELFRQRECQQAVEVFNHIYDDFKDSQYYSVLEIQSRSKLYKSLCEARLNPVQVELLEDEDYLMDGVFNLNSGNLELALERFKRLEEKNYNNPYLNYLLSLLYLKMGDTNNCLQYLNMAVEEDKYYKIVAYNEPDFEPMFDNEKFTSMVEMQDELAF